MLLLAFVVVAEVLAAGRQLVVHQGGQHLAQLQEEPFARRVAVGVHVEGDPSRPPLFRGGVER